MSTPVRWYAADKSGFGVEVQNCWSRSGSSRGRAPIDIDDKTRFMLFRSEADTVAALAWEIEHAEEELRQRICVALRPPRLDLVAGLQTTMRDRTSFMLDDVDRRTSLAEISSELLHGVRFAPTFTRSATQDLRDAACLDVALSLCARLGLPSFGYESVCAPLFQNTFDYVRTAAPAAQARSKAAAVRTRPNFALHVP